MDSHNQESVFDRIETLYNTDVSVRWGNIIMLLSDAVFNIFAGVFDILNDVRQNVAVVLLFLYSIIPNLDAIIRVYMLLCET